MGIRGIRIDMSLGEILGLLAVIAFFGYIIALAVVAFRTEVACLNHGYPTSHVGYNLQPFCTREENEYEITKPLSVIEQEAVND